VTQHDVDEENEQYQQRLTFIARTAKALGDKLTMAAQDRYPGDASAISDVVEMVIILAHAAVSDQYGPEASEIYDERLRSIVEEVLLPNHRGGKSAKDALP
jgi:hypothetical protein